MKNNNKNNNREQIFDCIIKEFDLFPYQEYIVRKMWKSKSYLIPVRCSGWSSTSALLTMIDVLTREGKNNAVKRP